MSFEDIRELLFAEERHLIPSTCLIEMLKVLVGDMEGMVMHRVLDLELPFCCIVRVRQLLKANIPINASNPYHVFLGQCLAQTRETCSSLDPLLGKMRTMARYMSEVNRSLLRSVGGPVWVGGGANGFGGSRA